MGLYLGWGVRGGGWGLGFESGLMVRVTGEGNSEGNNYGGGDS